MYLLSIFFPLISFLSLILFGRFVGKYGAIIIALFCMFFSFFISLILFFEVGLKGYICNLKLSSWFDSGLLNISWGFFFDILTINMLFVVTFISFLVHLYSVSYMGDDPHVIRFISFLSLFTFFMLILVSADNYVQFFLGWEGVGLCSYLLVNFWFTREQANKAAMKAIIVNRIGDFFLLLALLVIFYSFKTFDFIIINALTIEFEFFTFSFLDYNLKVLNLISFFLFLAAVGKSAQIGLHTWLPDAMEGPTPVSALIHAATMVTAGIFLLLRSSFILEYSTITLSFVTIFGALTAIFASTTGLFQNDLKKVIAYSTCSQLGFMFFSCGSSNYSLAMFHLFNHAFFKALLFLGAGVVIHALNDEQDMRKMGGIYKVLPFTYTSMLVGSIALAGFPFLTGFYSKDLILEIIVIKYNYDAFFAYVLASLATFFTSFYSFRLLVLSFLVNYKGARVLIYKAHESSIFMSFPLLLLAFFSIFIGFLCKDLFLGFGTNFWLNSFFIENYFVETSEFLPIYIKLLPFFFSSFGIILAIFVYNYSFTYIFRFFILFNNNFNIINKNIYFFFAKKWYFDLIYSKYIVKFFLYISHKFTFKLIDRGVIEYFGPLSLVRKIFLLSNSVIKVQTGYLYHYFIIFILGFFFFLYLYQLSFIFFFSDFFMIITFYLIIAIIFFSKL
jgi:NADH-ubiquinone oxidoreductase chain 5